MTGFEKVLRGCAITVGVLLAAFVGLVYWAFHAMGPGPQPDVEKAAHSATTEASDQAVTKQVDGQISRLRAALPWATYLGTAVADVCSTEEKPIAAIGAKESWLPVTCTRTDTVYEAFDGDFEQRLDQIDTVLDAAGWRLASPPTEGRVGERPGLAAELRIQHEPPRDPNPSELAAAAAWPNTVSLSYKVPVTPDFVAAPDANHYGRNRTGGQVEVTQAPYLPSRLDGGQSAHDLALKYPSDTTSFYRAWQPYTPDQVAKAYPGHGAVLVIEVSVSYATGG